jgi:hypothetical protein
LLIRLQAAAEAENVAAMSNAVKLGDEPEKDGSFGVKEKNFCVSILPSFF